MKTFSFNINISASIENVEITAENYEDAQYELEHLSLIKVAKKGDDCDFTIEDIQSCEVTEEWDD